MRKMADSNSNSSLVRLRLTVLILPLSRNSITRVSSVGEAMAPNTDTTLFIVLKIYRSSSSFRNVRNNDTSSTGETKCPGGGGRQAGRGGRGHHNIKERIFRSRFSMREVTTRRLSEKPGVLRRRGGGGANSSSTVGFYTCLVSVSVQS